MDTVTCIEQKAKQHYAGRYVRHYAEITWALQGQRCAICASKVKLTDVKADHCHETGFPRSALCHACNVFEGALWKATKEGGDTAAVVKRYEAQAVNRMKRKPRGWTSYGQRALILKERYWPMWDVWAEQAAGLRDGYEKAGHGKPPDALIVLCLTMVLTKWRGCVPMPGTCQTLWEIAREKDGYLLPCWTAVQPDTRRAFAVLAEVCRKAGLAALVPIFERVAA
jgi:hypothetical protein